MNVVVLLRTLFGALLLLVAAASANAQVAPTQTIWRLLDYMAVDYGGAVAGGRVINPVEYKEMVEFAGSVRGRMAALPEGPTRAVLVRDADALGAAIAEKADPKVVGASAKRLAAALLAAYPVPLAPKAAPDMARADKLYADNCASCHGSDGRANTATARALDPAPIAFADEARARERSVFALYQVLEQGLDGTAMRAFLELSAEERWALSFKAGSFAYSDALAQEGERLWRDDASVRAVIPDLAALVSATPAELEARVGEDRAKALIAYLRRHPEAANAPPVNGPLGVARAKVAAAMRAYESGDAHGAGELALSAYLDGFEPLEPVLASRDGALMQRVELAMGGLREAIGESQSVDAVRRHAVAIDGLMNEAELVLAPRQASAASSFVGAFTVLLREGLEALLIVIAMIAFLRKADRRDAIRYVHGGWIAALVAGFATWWAATSLIEISGASRELTEGFGALFAAVVLVSVGIWMYGKAQADEWQRYIKAKLTHALSLRSAWFLAGLAFVVVYREVFETILFFTAMSGSGSNAAVVAGGGTAAVLLGGIAWVMLRYSRTLPIAKVFGWSSALIAVLAIVLAGKGVAALQEAGVLDIKLLDAVPRIEWLGVFPTAQVVAAQLLALAVLGVGFWYNRNVTGKAAS